MSRWQCPAPGVAAYGQSILGNVKKFVGKRSQSDDMCLVCLGRISKQGGRLPGFVFSSWWASWTT